MTVEFDIPGLELKSENWWRRSHPGWLLAKQRDREKDTVLMRCLSFGRAQFPRAAPYRVTLTRFSNSAKGLDDDGLQGAFKYTRDAICRFLGIDDGDREGIRFEYAHLRQPSFGIRIRIEGA